MCLPVKADADDPSSRLVAAAWRRTSPADHDPAELKYDRDLRWIQKVVGVDGFRVFEGAHEQPLLRA
jgi:hypothetical protein